MANTAFIIDASSGIGAECFRLRARRGGHVIPTARSMGTLAADLREPHGAAAHDLAIDLGALDLAGKAGAAGRTGDSEQCTAHLSCRLDHLAASRQQV